MTNDIGIVGSLRAADGKGVVRMADRYDTDINDLWSALTNPDRLARWIAVIKGDLVIGGEFHASFTSGWDGPCRVDVCDSPHRLQITMNPGEPDETVVEAVLAADDDGTKLVIEDRGLPLTDYAYHGAGWQAHVEDLATYLAGREPSDWRARWEQLTPKYLELAKNVTGA
ncbi:MAG TPA: SRPBCC family protein [Pseudonocardiaceae bacterium]|nr:SRPBCC family protein [Pseudonocardiaceae bacterium]